MTQLLLPTRLLSMLALLACPAIASGQTTVMPGQAVPEMEGVGIEQKLDAIVPMDLQFTDAEGDTVLMGDFLNREKPVILTLNYYRCPMLCSLTLNGMVDGLKDLDWSIGEEFDVVTVSINPDEGPEIAARKKRAYVAQYGRETAGSGWSFLTGREDQVQQLADSVGFGYRYDEVSGEYAHTSSIIFLTPDGRISKYMNDVVFKPRDLRLAIVESSEGRVGSAIDTLLLFNCFQWDPERNSYVASAWKIMRLGGVLTIILVAAGLVVLGFRNSRGDGAGPGKVNGSAMTAGGSAS